MAFRLRVRDAISRCPAGNLRAARRHARRVSPAIIVGAMRVSRGGARPFHRSPTLAPLSATCKAASDAAVAEHADGRVSSRPPDFAARRAAIGMANETKNTRKQISWFGTCPQSHLNY